MESLSAVEPEATADCPGKPVDGAGLGVEVIPGIMVVAVRVLGCLLLEFQMPIVEAEVQVGLVVRSFLAQWVRQVMQ